MSGAEILDALSNSEYAQWVNQSWGWPLALTIHAFGMAVTVCFMFIVGLRLFGLFQTIPYTSLRALIPYVWVALIFQTISGFTLWMTKPAQYLADGMFQIKFTLVIVGAIVMGLFHANFRREVAGWEQSGAVSVRGRRYVAATCLLWAAVTIGGRLTAYLGSLYLR
jgi:hypothetical protein